MDTQENIERLNKRIDMERESQQACIASGSAVETLGLTNSAAAQFELPKVKVALTGSAAETLRCLFFHGPTWDGNVPSKTGRDELVNMGLAARANGWQWLTRAGIDACFANKIHDEKDLREARERKRRHVIEDAARQILG